MKFSRALKTGFLSLILLSSSVFVPSLSEAGPLWELQGSVEFADWHSKFSPEFERQIETIYTKTFFKDLKNLNFQGNAEVHASLKIVAGELRFEIETYSDLDQRSIAQLTEAADHALAMAQTAAESYLKPRQKIQTAASLKSDQANTLSAEKGKKLFENDIQKRGLLVDRYGEKAIDQLVILVGPTPDPQTLYKQLFNLEKLNQYRQSRASDMHVLENYRSIRNSLLVFIQTLYGPETCNGLLSE